MANSRNYSERLHVWEGWRRAVGQKMRTLYEDYVDLKNEASKLNGNCHRVYMSRSFAVLRNKQ